MKAKEAKGKEREVDGHNYRDTNFREEDYRNKFKETLNVSPLHFSPEEIPPGVIYRWICAEIHGAPNDGRVTQVQRLHWTPVPPERHPDRCLPDIFGRVNHLSNVIHYKGLVLFERPMDIERMEQEKLDKTNYEAVHSLSGSANFMSDPTMPIYAQKHETIAPGGKSFQRG